MIESSQGGAEAVSSEFQLYRILCLPELRGVLEHPEHPLSLASQTPYFSEERERGSGNTAYRKFFQAKECGASNEIARFQISICH